MPSGSHPPASQTCNSLQIVAACTEAIKLVLPIKAPRNGVVAEIGHVLLTWQLNPCKGRLALLGLLSSLG